MSSTKTVLLVGSGEQLYREYVLSSIAREAPVWLLDAAEPTWQRPHLAGWTAVDAADASALCAAARRVASSREISGVICYDEALILPAAHVVDALGVPGMSPESVRRCRDKLATRRALARAGVPQPGAREAATLAEARAAADQLGYPVVLKPRGLGASQGVVLVNHPDRLDDAWITATSACHPGVPTYRSVLVEECVVGPEISVDGYVAGGRYEILFLAHKYLALAPFFEEIAHIVDAADPLVEAPDLRAVLETTHAALGIDRGMTHTEIRLTASGPRVIEVNGRLGGDLIPFVGRQATGVDPGSVAASIATGGFPAVRATRSGCVGIRFCYPPEDCRVTSISVPLPDPSIGLIAAAALAPPGSEVRLPPRGYAERHAHVICEGRDRRQCASRLAAAAARVELVWEPLSECVPAAASASTGP
jgi:biotin carboxylase